MITLQSFSCNIAICENVWESKEHVWVIMSDHKKSEEAPSVL